MCGRICATEITLFIIVLISIPFYILFITMLIRKRHIPKFSSPFYRIITWLGIVDLVMITHYYLFQRTLRWSLLLSMHRWGGQWLLKYWSFVTLGSQRCQQLLLLAASINRYMALVHPLRHDQSWTIRKTNLSIAACIAVGLGTYSFMPILCEFDHEPVNNGTGLWIKWQPMCWKAALLGTSLLTFILSIVFIVLYCIMFVSSWRRAKRVAAGRGSTRTSERASRNLAIMGAVLSMLVVVNGVQYAVMATFADHYKMHQDMYQLLLTVVVVVFAVCNPWLTVACCPSVRKGLRQFVGGKEHTVVTQNNITKWQKTELRAESQL